MCFLRESPVSLTLHSHSLQRVMSRQWTSRLLEWVAVMPRLCIRIWRWICANIGICRCSFMLMHLNQTLQTFRMISLPSSSDLVLTIRATIMNMRFRWSLLLRANIAHIQVLIVGLYGQRKICWTSVLASSLHWKRRVTRQRMKAWHHIMQSLVHTMMIIRRTGWASWVILRLAKLRPWWLVSETSRTQRRAVRCGSMSFVFVILKVLAVGLHREISTCSCQTSVVSMLLVNTQVRDSADLRKVWLHALLITSLHTALPPIWNSVSSSRRKQRLRLHYIIVLRARRHLLSSIRLIQIWNLMMLLKQLISVIVKPLSKSLSWRT